MWNLAGLWRVGRNTRSLGLWMDVVLKEETWCIFLNILVYLFYMNILEGCILKISWEKVTKKGCWGCLGSWKSEDFCWQEEKFLNYQGSKGLILDFYLCYSSNFSFAKSLLFQKLTSLFLLNLAKTHFSPTLLTSSQLDSFEFAESWSIFIIRKKQIILN